MRGQRRRVQRPTYHPRLMPLIEEVCRQRGLTPSRLADALGVTEWTVNRWLNRERFPDPVYLVRLADVLGCNIGDLYVVKPAEA